MITKLTEQKGCIIAEFIDLKRFTLAVTEEVKSELKPILSQEGNKMIFDFKNIEFIDSSGIGCIISLGEFYQFNLSSCIRQQNSLTAQFVSFSLSNLANIFYPPQFLQ